MIENLSNFSFTGITIPGCIYFISDEHIRESDAGPIEYLYFIDEDRQILPALIMEISYVEGEYDEIKFLGVCPIDDDCHKFEFACIEKVSQEKSSYVLYLHRMSSFAECVSGRKDHFKFKQLYLEAVVRELQMQLQEDLNAIGPETNPIEGYDKRVEMVEIAIKRMKEHLSAKSFPDRDCEIQYFKFWSLPFIKLYIYYITLYNLETIRITCDKEQFVQHLEYEKKRVMEFFIEHQELYRYFKAGRSDEDEMHFTFKMPSRTTDFLTADSAFCRASLILGELLAYEEYKILLEDEIERIKAGNLAGKKIEIRLPKSAVAEVIVPIYELQWIYIDGRPATLNELIKMVERGFNIDMKDFSVLDNANRCRKKTTCPVLEKMRQVWEDRRERLDS